MFTLGAEGCKPRRRLSSLVNDSDFLLLFVSCQLLVLWKFSNWCPGKVLLNLWSTRGWVGDGSYIL